ncbi:MAG: response regulator [Spirochaetaceae bacterium]|jgi:signal transduction histidine kinase/FixJ family two-component response regulator|nr:response regulator [Spirochaetaceae bacterium]
MILPVLLRVLAGASVFASLLILFRAVNAWGEARMKNFTLYTALCAFCAVAWYLQIGARSLEGALAGLRLRFIAAPFLPLAAQLCGLEYNDRPQRYRLPLGILTIALSFLILAALFADPESAFFVRNAVFSQAGPGTLFTYRPGPVYRFFLIYSLCLEVLLIFNLGAYLWGRRLGAAPFAAFFVIFSLSFFADLIFLLGIFPACDFSIAARALSLVLMYRYILHYRELEWYRLDWDDVAGNLSSAVMVLNDRKNIVKVNSAFLSFFPAFSWRENETSLLDFTALLRRRSVEASPESLLDDLAADGTEPSVSRDLLAETEDARLGEIILEPGRQSFTLNSRIIWERPRNRPPGLRRRERMLGQVIILNDVSSYRRMIEEINALRIRAEQASRAKAEFLAVMSHELRTPLNAIIGYAEVLLHKTLPAAGEADRGAPAAYGEMRVNLEQIRDAGRALLNIINNILDISKIEDGNLEPLSVPYRTGRLLVEVLRQNLPGLRNKQVRFQLEIPPDLPAELMGDELRIAQILNNLLSNAIKFTERGIVSLRLEWEREGEHRAFLVFELSDTGPGIESEFLPDLFTRQSRLNSAVSGSRSGTGLGLVISRNLAELMGGTVTVKSETGKGSVFTAMIRQVIPSYDPIGEEAVEGLKNIGPGTELGPASSSLRMTGRILVVDDMQTNIDVTQALLRAQGIESDSASSGGEAVEILRLGEKHYDLILMDHLMPGMDGFEAARSIRGLDRNYARAVPIVMLTALSPDDEAGISPGETVNGFLFKPLEPQKLRECLEAWMPRDYAPPQEALPEKEAPWELFSLTGVDVVKGIASAGGAVDGYLRLLELFEGDAPRRLSGLAAALRAGDMPGCARQLRPLRSALRGIGAGEAAGAGERLLEAAQGGDRAALEEGAPDFILRAGSLIKEIAALLEGQKDRRGGA